MIGLLILVISISFPIDYLGKGDLFLKEVTASDNDRIDSSIDKDEKKSFLLKDRTEFSNIEAFREDVFFNEEQEFDLEESFILKPTYAPNEVIVKYKSGKLETEKDELKKVTENQEALFRGENLKKTISENSRFRKKGRDARKVSKELKEIKKINLNSEVDVLVVLDELKKDSNVESVQLNYIYTPDVVPNDAKFSEQYGPIITSAPKGWDIETGEESVIIAIIDEGTDWKHEDLANKIWNNGDEISGNGIDDDNNGYIDDVRGWDFDAGDSDPSGGVHGTETAGVAGARQIMQ